MTRKEYRKAKRAYAEVRQQMATEEAPAGRGAEWLVWLGTAVAVVLAAMNYLSGIAI